MTVKICLNNQTHRISKHPQNFTTLLQKIVEIFGNQLPQRWTLQYLDSDNDKVMLSSQEDYRALLEEEIGNSSKSVKIFIEALGENQSNADLSTMLESQKKENVVVEKPVVILEDGEDTYILEAKEDLIKNEEVIPIQVQEEKVAENVLSEAVIEEEQSKVETEQKEIPILHQVPADKLNEKTLKVLSPEQLEKVQERKQKLKEKQLKFKQLLVEKQAKKKNEFRDAVTEIILEQLPIIASLTKDLIQDNKTEQQIPKLEENTSIHRHVRCDGCNVDPIVGIRYKCYACHNFDYCEKCEATQEHDHPFIKFKQPQSYCFENRLFGRHRHQPQPEPLIPHNLKMFSQIFGGIKSTIPQNPQPEAQLEVKPEPEEVVEKVEEVVIEEIKKRKEVVIEEIKPEEEVKVEEIMKEKKEYDAKTVEKAEKLKELFADLDLESVLEFVSQVPNYRFEELVDCYQKF